MDDAARDFFRRLLETPSPSGYEQPVQAVVREWAGGFADDVSTDRHGNVFAARFPLGRPADAPRVMLAGHCDQTALMVQYVDPDGFLYVQPIGGWDMQILLGQFVTVWAGGGPVPGVIGRRAIHLMSPDERTKVPGFTDIWVDAGFASKAEAEESVRPGDPITLTLGQRPLRGPLVAGTGLDDKVGLWVVLEAVRQLRGRELSAAVVAVSTVAEEVGLRGATTAAYAVDPVVGIAVDVCHATDTPNNDKKSHGDVRIGHGPVLFRGPNISPRVFDKLEATAKAHGIPVQVRGVPKATGTDANSIQISRAGVATGLVGIPNRYMHSPVEIVHRDDLTHAAALLAEFCANVSAGDDWIP